MEPPPVPEPNEQLAALHQAIDLLHEPDKALILLYLDDLSYADMAEITGLTENHIGVKLSRIKSKLKNLLLHGKS
jgi:RNA polymerase sigma-70 factor (ECF subfamily)